MSIIAARIECRSRSCRVEIAGDGAQFLPSFALRIAGTSNSMSAGRTAYPGG